MFQQNSLAKLYPHLQFGRIPAPSVSQSKIPNPIRSTSVHSNRSVNSEKNLSEREKTPIREDSPPVVKNEEPVKKTEKIKKVKVVEPTPEPPKPIEPPKPTVVKRPNRVKPEPKPEPKRVSQVPVKGEQGLQRKYTADQRKQMYLDRLSRKSVKNAEKEIAKVNEVLESVDHDVQKLAEVEREFKGKLKLINYAKYFTGQQDAKHLSINESSKQNDTGADLSSQPKGSTMSSGDRDTPGTVERGRGRRSRKISSRENGDKPNERLTIPDHGDECDSTTPSDGETSGSSEGTSD